MLSELRVAFRRWRLVRRARRAQRAIFALFDSYDCGARLMDEIAGGALSREITIRDEAIAELKELENG